MVAGQLLIFFQIEHREVQAVMLAFLVFQIWRKFKTNLADESEGWQIDLRKVWMLNCLWNKVK